MVSFLFIVMYNVDVSDILILMCLSWGTDDKWSEMGFYLNVVNEFL